MSQKKNVGKRRSSYYKEPDKKMVWLQLLPLLVVVGIIPLICKQVVYSAKMSEYTWFTTDDMTFSFFIIKHSYF